MDAGRVLGRARRGGRRVELREDRAAGEDRIDQTGELSVIAAGIEEPDRGVLIDDAGGRRGQVGLGDDA